MEGSENVFNAGNYVTEEGVLTAIAKEEDVHYQGESAIGKVKEEIELYQNPPLLQYPPSP